MRQFMRPGGIERLSLEARVLYTGFAVFMLVGYVTSAWFYLDDDLGVSPGAAAGYYLGDPAPPLPAEEASAGEVELDLEGAEPGADEAAPVGGADLRFEKPARQVMETFHFHLFSIPVVLLIIAHLYMLCDQSSRFKVIVIAVTSTVTLVHMLAPVLIRFVSAGFGFLMFPSAVLMGITWTYMTLWPIVEMWRAPLPDGRPITGRIGIG